MRRDRSVGQVELLVSMSMGLSMGLSTVVVADEGAAMRSRGRSLNRPQLLLRHRQIASLAITRMAIRLICILMATDTVMMLVPLVEVLLLLWMHPDLVVMIGVWRRVRGHRLLLAVVKVRLRLSVRQPVGDGIFLEERLLLLLHVARLLLLMRRKVLMRVIVLVRRSELLERLR